MKWFFYMLGNVAIAGIMAWDQGFVPAIFFFLLLWGIIWAMQTHYYAVIDDENARKLLDGIQQLHKTINK